MAFYSLFIPHQTAGANVIHFDLWNGAGSASWLKLHCVQPVVSGEVAVTGAVSVALFLERTSAIGTSGTAATYEGTDPTATTISGIDTTQRCSPSITARRLPTGGATAGAVLDHCNVFTEETNAGAYAVSINLARPSGLTDVPAVTIREGSGVRVVQGSVASVGEVGYNVVFEVLPNA